MDKHEEILSKYHSFKEAGIECVTKSDALKAMQEASLREQPLREALRKMDKVIKCLAIELQEAVLKSVVTEWEEFKQTALAGEGELKEEERERVQKFDKTSHDNNSFIL